ncbi:hypothetical protein B0H14DRAFT_3645145 [Mycena olivaceomarginata]|nr:hypothetical protein B0H14DRAFT_3645145 [Mycena olivaceomarginata]
MGKRQLEDQEGKHLIYARKIRASCGPEDTTGLIRQISAGMMCAEAGETKSHSPGARKPKESRPATRFLRPAVHGPVLRVRREVEKALGLEMKSDIAGLQRLRGRGGVRTVEKKNKPKELTLEARQRKRKGACLYGDLAQVLHHLIKERARRRFELHRRRCDLKCRGSAGSAVSAQIRRTETCRGALPRLSEIPSAEGGYRWKHGVRIASVRSVPRQPVAPSSQQTQPALVMGSRRAESSTSGAYRAEDGRGKRRGGTAAACTAHGRWCPSCSWEMKAVARGVGSGCCKYLRTRGVVHASALRACGSRRAVLAGDALGARGGDKGGAGDGERPLHALRTQKAMKYTAEESRCAGRRRSVVGGKERQRRVLRAQLVARVGLVFAPAWCRAHGRGRNDRARLWQIARAVVVLQMVPRAASGAAGRGARRMGHRHRGEGVGGVRRTTTLPYGRRCLKIVAGASSRSLDFWALRAGCARVGWLTRKAGEGKGKREEKRTQKGSESYLGGFAWHGLERTYTMLDVLARITIEEWSSSTCYAQSMNEEEISENQMHTDYASKMTEHLQDHKGRSMRVKGDVQCSRCGFAAQAGNPKPYAANERTGVELGKLFSRHSGPTSKMAASGESRLSGGLRGRKRVGHREASSGHGPKESKGCLLGKRAGAAESIITHFAEYDIISQPTAPERRTKRRLECLQRERYDRDAMPLFIHAVIHRASVRQHVWGVVRRREWEGTRAGALADDAQCNTLFVHGHQWKPWTISLGKWSARAGESAAPAMKNSDREHCACKWCARGGGVETSAGDSRRKREARKAAYARWNGRSGRRARQ